MHLKAEQIASFQQELGALGYKFQFVTLSAFHSLNLAMFELATGYRERGMAAYAELQQREFAAEKDGYEAVRHQEFVGTGYFDEVTGIVTGGKASSVAMKGSTETEQFHEVSPAR
jgi:isocitrate lyase